MDPFNLRIMTAEAKRLGVETLAYVWDSEDPEWLIQYLDQESVKGEPPFVPITLAGVERRQIRGMLKHTKGNKTKAAKLLGITTATLYNKLRRYDGQA